jgi:PAS domain S-box-containing protein
MNARLWDRVEDRELRLEFETLIADLSSRFINLPPDELDREIEEALSRVCLSLGIDYAVLWQWSSAAPNVIAPTHVYYGLPGEPPAGPLDQEQFPWYVQQMLAGRTVVVASLDDLPAAAAVDRDVCLALGVRSTLCLPLSVGGEPPVGALGLNALRAERDWPDALVNRLNLVAQVFTNALARRRHDLERQKLLAGLQEAEELVSMAADSANAGLWSLAYRTGMFWASVRARKMFGYQPDEELTMARLENSIHPDEREFIRQALERSRQTGEDIAVEYRIFTPDGRLRWIASSGRPRLYFNGIPERFAGVSIDITDRKLAEEQLRESEANLASGVDLAGLGFYRVDFSRGTATIDDRMREMTGMPPGPDQGLDALVFWLEHLHPDDRQRVMDERERLHGGQVERLSIEYRFLHPIQGVKWVHHLARVTDRDASGMAIRTFGVLMDITARRQAEESLRQSYAEIARLNDRLRAEGEYLKAELKLTETHAKIVGRSAGIRNVLHLAGQVAPTDTSVFVYGETGTGKELIAQAVHRLSSRRDHTMVKVNCASLPAGLVESELFGRERGAFTGAMTQQIGRFEIADGSTLFLDEIGELPIELQAKLLRVLESGEFERLGSPKTIKVNVRVVAATNRDLSAAIKQGKFREDLYYRLNVFPLHVPPLRERADDIPLLVWSFLEEFSSRMGKRITRIHSKTMEALQRRAWPGNVRELRNVIEHAAIITSGDTLIIPTPDADAPPAAASGQTLSEAERAHILRALERSGGQIKGLNGAAAKLGINPSTLVSRMKKLEIRLPGRAARGRA